MTMAPGLRKLTLTAHLTLSIGWLGAVVAFLALAIVGVASQEVHMMRSACLAMGLLVSYVIVPLALASLVSGLVSALGTKWGLVRHYWVILKLALTIASIVVLLVQVAPINEVAELAAALDSSVATLRGLSKRPLIHAAGGLMVLLVIQVLGVYKPHGLTGHGRRKLAAIEAGSNGQGEH